LIIAFPLNSNADVRTRYGALVKSDVSVEGAVTGTYQASNDGRLENEALASLDLLAHRNLGKGQLTLYVEAVTTPQVDGIADNIWEVNGDAGTALDAWDKGRFQVSELHFTCVRTESCFSAGLLDPSAFADISNVANDETTQFLNQGFINNPTIRFPDYSLGFVWHQDYQPGQPGYTLLLASSHGLADNPNRSYSELFDVTENGKGLFSLVETYALFQKIHLRAGIWHSSADYPQLDNPAIETHNYGLYTTLDYYTGKTSWNLRLGAANPRVSPYAYYSSLAVEHPIGDVTTGLAVGHTWLSSRLAEEQQEDRTNLEIYARFTPAERLSLSPSIQLIRNPAFERGNSTLKNPLAIFSLRLGYHF
ncbi:MAG: hypothetical protein PVJ10_04110, partial [Thiohalophilus sp.]